ncbi:MAG: uncharacterized protein PWP65_1225 [Clostridia bacterium]|nr:uncharacterized protein [Clostridia bacterium]
MFDLSWLAACGVIVLAAALQGITGFGFALISMPLLLLIYDAHTSVALNMIVSFFSLSLLTYRCHRDILRPVTKNIFLGSIIGIPFGVYVFLNFNVNNLKLLASSVVTLFSLILILNGRIHKAGGDQKLEYKPEVYTSRREKNWQRIIGSLSGFLTGSVSMPGPPVILFLNQRALPKDKFRATTAAYFVLVYPTSLLALTISGAVNSRIALLALTLMPFAFLGNNLGVRLFPLVPQKIFQQGVPLLVLATALYSIVTTIF